MKKIQFVLAAIALLAMSCEKESGFKEATVKYSFTVSVENVDTKATLGENGVFQWEAGDEIAVYTTDHSKVRFVAENAGSSVTFSSTEVPVGESFDNTSIAFYPYSSVVDESTISYPSSYASVDELNRSFPMKGSISGSSISFAHLGGVLRLTVNEIPSATTTVTFTADGCSGNFDAIGTEIAKGSSSASVAITLGSVEKSKVELSIPLPVGSYSGFTMTFNDSASSAKSTASGFTIKRKTILPVKGFIVTGAPDTAMRVIGGFNSWNPESGCISMAPVTEHAGWYVAQRVTIGDNSEAGIKILTANVEGDDWWGNIGTEKTTARGTFLRIPTTKGNNNIFVATGGKYDVYYNSSFGMVVAPVGATMIKHINFLMEYLDNSFNPNNITAHVWKDGGSDCDTWGEEPAPTGETMQVGNNIYQVISYPLWDSPRNNFWESGSYGIIPKRGVNGWRLCGSSFQTTFTTGSETDYYFHVGREQFAQITDPAAELTSFITAYGFFNNNDTAGVEGKVNGGYVVFKNLVPDGLGSRIKLQDRASNLGQTLGKSDSGSPTTGGDANLGEAYTPYMRWQDGTNNSIKINGLDKSGATSYDVYYNLFAKKLYVLVAGEVPAE